jgi:tetratricopeptide (TPR) repeat protein
MPAKILASLICLVLAVGPAAAQDVDQEYRRPGIEQGKASQQTAAAEAAQGEISDDVTFEQVLADPDNQQLNYRYARSQVRRGDLKGAAATLERMLLIDPNKPRIRLFYAVVLFRLDNTVEAKRELDTLKKLNLGGALGEEVEAYRKAIENRTKKNHISGRAGVGFQYDTNRNAAPSEGSRLFADTPIPLATANMRRDDTSTLFLTGLDYKRDVGHGTQLMLSGNYYHAAQTLVKTLNLQAYSLSGGAVIHRARNTFTPTFVYDHVLLAQSSYLRSRGVDLRFERKMGKRGDIYFQFRDVYQDFVRNRIVATADERDGIQVDAIIGGNYVLNPKMRAGLGLQRTWKHATRHYNAFDRTGLLASHIWLLGKGTFLLSNATLYHDVYKQVDRAISRNARQDTIWRGSATFGAPMTLIHKSLKSLIWTASYEYYHSMSTIQNYSYTNDKIGTMVTYKFDLGF